MTLVDMPSFVGNSNLAHANGGCYRCRRGDNLVDTDVQIEGEGILALCKGCIADFAQTCGLLHNEAEWAELRAKNLTLEVEVERLSKVTHPATLDEILDAFNESLARRDAAPETQCPATTAAGTRCKHVLRNGLCPSHGAPETVVR